MTAPPRRSVLALSALALAAAGVIAAPPAQACACGGFVAPEGYDSQVYREQAVLQWDGVRETVVVELGALSDAPTMGLIIPTPTPATAALADPAMFTELDVLTAPQPVVDRYRWWPDRDFGDSASAPEAGGVPPVQVLGEVRLGPLDVTTLAASDAEALRDWLDAQGFELPDTFAEALEPYIADGWSYVAARIAPEAEASFDGTLDPIRLTFDSDELVYPMRLSAAATTAQRVRTFVLADHRMQRTDATDAQRPAELTFAGSVDAATIDSTELADLVAGGSYLTVHENDFATPESQIVSDFVFDVAPDDVPYVQTYSVVADKRIGPFYAGPVLAVLGMGGAALVALVFVLVVGPRRRV